MGTGPPPAEVISRPRLFRLLLSVPRPTLPIPFRFDGIDARLSVRGLLGSELAAAIDECADVTPAAVQRSTVTAGIISRALLADGRPFLTASDVADLPDSEAKRLRAAVMPALDIVSPMWARCDLPAWTAAICEGAHHGSNVLASAIVGATDKPERYFGLLLNEMTDGHWIAYRAVRLLHEKK